MIEIKEEDMIYRDFLDFKDVKHNPNLVIINENAYELKQQILQNEKLRELVESVISEYGKKHNGVNTVNCSMCFNSKQLQHLLEESKK